jgi:hypothetical protein
MADGAIDGRELDRLGCRNAFGASRCLIIRLIIRRSDLEMTADPLDV